MAKLIIRLINGVGEVVNQDPDVAGRLKVVFFPDFNVKNAKYVYPAADLSEQISTAGKEASGTGNMKFSLNGPDDRNPRWRQRRDPGRGGADNFFLFGLTAEQVYELKAKGYHPKQYYDSDPELREAVDQIASGLSPEEIGTFLNRSSILCCMAIPISCLPIIARMWKARAGEPCL